MMTTNEEERQKAALNYLFFPAIYFLVTKESRSLVIFHAKQSLIFGLVFILGNILLGLIPLVGWSLLPIWNIIFFLGWLFLIIKAYQGEEYKIPWLVDFVLEKISRNKK
ncbi:MAG: DUF4870 domain-containing protein [Candidatus Shapirobacteria bacterium]|nr:DUF4870 domain-containing protein [Candidatus Shapirobacteria bacterium]